MKTRYIKLALVLTFILVTGSIFIYKYTYQPTITISDWSIKTYKEAKIEGDASTSITIKSQAGGLYFTSSAPTKKANCIQITGQHLQGTATLRMRINDNPPTYLQAPEGSVELSIPTHNTLELMIYADSPFSYQLDELTLASCKDSVTEEEFKAYILKQIPDLKEALAEQDTLKASSLLLHWSARVSDLGSKIPKNALILSASSLSASEIFEIWDKDLGGGSCGAFAVFYAKVLKLFDINSFTIDMGLDSDPNLRFTHVTTIVALPNGNNWNFYLFDPTSDGTFINNQANYVNLKAVLDSYDTQNKVLAENFWTAPSCLPRDVTRFNADGILDGIEKDKPYCIANLIRGWGKRAKTNNSIWANQFENYLTNPNASLFIDMMPNEIYSVGPALNEDSRQAFLKMMSEYNSKIPLN